MTDSGTGELVSVFIGEYPRNDLPFISPPSWVVQETFDSLPPEYTRNSANHTFGDESPKLLFPCKLSAASDPGMDMVGLYGTSVHIVINDQETYSVP